MLCPRRDQDWYWGRGKVVIDTHLNSDDYYTSDKAKGRALYQTKLLAKDWGGKVAGMRRARLKVPADAPVGYYHCRGW